MSRGNILIIIIIIKTKSNWQSNGSPILRESKLIKHKKAARHLALALRITPSCLSRSDNWAITQLIFLLWSSDLLRGETARLLEKLQSMNGRLFPAVRVNFSLATVVRHRDRIPPNSYSKQPICQAATPGRSVRKDPKMEKQLFGVSRGDKLGKLFHALSPPSVTNFTAFKCAHGPSRERARSRAVTRLVFYFPNVSAPCQWERRGHSQAHVNMQKLWRTQRKQHPDSKT